MLEELLSDGPCSSHVAFLHEPRTPAESGRLACALHAVLIPLAEIREPIEKLEDSILQYRDFGSSETS